MADDKVYYLYFFENYNNSTELISDKNSEFLSATFKEKYLIYDKSILNKSDVYTSN